WLLSLAQGLQAQVQGEAGTAQHVLGRLNGSDFVLLIEDVDASVLQRLVQAIYQELMRQRIQLDNGAFCRWALAQTDFEGDESFSHVLARLDQALMRAESAGHGEVEVLLRHTSDAPEEYLTKGESQWRARLQIALQEGIFILGVNDWILHDDVWHEATLMLRGQSITMTQEDEAEIGRAHV